MLINPPNFQISAKCCDYAKKNPVHKLIKKEDYDLSIVGVRMYEGGARSASYKNCFTEYFDRADEYRPLFYYTNNDKKCYEKHFDIINSDCYCVYGLKRTGCVGCPFGKNLNDEIDVVKNFEPKLYKAISNIFADTYAYTELYKSFCEEMNKKYGSYANYLRTKN